MAGAQLSSAVNFSWENGQVVPAFIVFNHSCLISVTASFCWRTSGKILLAIHHLDQCFSHACWQLQVCKGDFYLSKTQLDDSYAGIHSCFSLHFLPILISQTLRVIKMPCKLTGEWSQIHNYLNFLFCPQRASWYGRYVFTYSARPCEVKRKDVSAVFSSRQSGKWPPLDIFSLKWPLWTRKEMHFVPLSWDTGVLVKEYMELTPVLCHEPR